MITEHIQAAYTLNNQDTENMCTLCTLSLLPADRDHTSFLLLLHELYRICIFRRGITISNSIATHLLKVIVCFLYILTEN